MMSGVPQPGDPETLLSVSVPFNRSLILVTERDVDSHQGLIAVIPTYNEQSTLGSVVLQARKYVDRVIVVDDNSTDKTPVIAKLAGAEVISLHIHTGKAYALLLGLKSARELGCKAVVYLGSDGYSYIHDIPKIAARTLSGEADLVIGSHYLESESSLAANRKIKNLIYKIPKKSDNSSAFTDPFSNIRSFSRKALENLDFKTDGYNIDTDIIVHLLSQGLVVDEISLTNLSAHSSDPNWGNPIKVLAAMPAFNEEKFIAKTIVGAKNYVDQVLVVDDGSTDATKEIAEESGAIVIQHKINSGYGASLQTIFDKARNLHVEALVILDADGQHNPTDVGRLLEALAMSEVDVVIGSRFLKEDDKQIPGYRKIGMKVLDSATKIAGVSEISDSQSGFRAYGKRAIDAINLTGDGMSAGSEILIQISDHKLTIAEVPINVRYDIEGTSSQNPVKHGVSVLSNIIGLISYRRPLPAFGISGLIMFLLGIAWGFFAIYNYEKNGFVSIPLTIICVMFLFFGLGLGITGLILNTLIIIVKNEKR